jgi:hypothetical protein
MVEAQHALGGGVLSFVIEHVGDLTNRMAKKWHLSDAGYDYVNDKVTKTLRTLRQRYGFEREYRENLAANAQYQHQDLGEFTRGATERLRNYARAHYQLPVYNRAQYIAREAAVALGKQDFEVATRLLEKLEPLLEEEATWKVAALEYQLAPDGSVQQFPW